MKLPLTYSPLNGIIRGADASELIRFYPANDPIRQIEIASIRQWMEGQRRYLAGRVLDYGAGKVNTCRSPEPYRDLVSGSYVPFDIDDKDPGGQFDAIICTQVIQYHPDPVELMDEFWRRLKHGGNLLLSYPAAWPESETCDYWRFTLQGMERLLKAAGFKISAHDLRARISFGDFSGSQFALGYGCIAHK